MKKVITKTNDSLNIQEYYQVLLDIKIQIDQSLVDAYALINLALNKRNWFIGKIITEKQAEYSWGSSFIDTLAQDIQKLYPGIEGFSRTNLFRMKAFYDAYKNPAAAGQLEDLPVFNIPWHHNSVILEKVKDSHKRMWYAYKSYQNGWSRTTLEGQIKKNLFSRDGQAISNFHTALQNPNAELAKQTFKDPYIFDFLKLNDEHVEYELEQGLIDNTINTLLEMGKGFALVGRQEHIQVGGEDFYIDLLFFHIRLKCYVVVELKARKFDKSDIGQLNFYISAVDNLIRKDGENPTIGLLLCKSKNDIVAKYTLEGINRPIGVAEYTTDIMEELELEFKSNMPTIAELEAELKKADIIHSPISIKIKPKIKTIRMKKITSKKS